MNLSREGYIPNYLVRDHLNNMIEERSFINLNQESPMWSKLVKKVEDPVYSEIPKDESEVHIEISDNYSDIHDPKYKYFLSDLIIKKPSVYNSKCQLDDEEKHDAGKINKKWNVKEKKTKKTRKLEKITPTGIKSFFGNKWRPVLPRCGLIKHERNSSESED